MNNLLKFSDLAAEADVGLNRLAGLYPWLRFENCTREQWAEWHGIDLQYVNERAANAYLEGERAFFEKWESDYASAHGRHRADELKQRTLEDIRSQFNHAAANLCKSPIETLLLAPLVWTRYAYETGP